MTYTDAQLVVLSAASQRDDGLLPRPAKLAGAVLRSFEAALVKVGAAEPITVRTDQPSWRLDDAETPVGLRITRAGLAAIGIEPAEPADGARQTIQGEGQPTSDQALPTVSTLAAPLQVGTKRALLVELLSSAEGASVEDLVTALAWQPHTVRAALTRLRQAGFAIVATKDAHKRAVYRINGSEPQGSADSASDVGAVAR